jgi:alkylation response protein AidB-like acyl-CoA dehydrogenase
VKFDLTEEQELFRQTGHRFLEREASSDAVRGLWDSPNGMESEWWQRAAALGWSSPFVPDRFGGGSLTGRPLADVSIVAEEIGRFVAPGPLAPVNVVADAVASHGSEEQKSSLLPVLVDGSSIATWAVAERETGWNLEGVATRADIEGESVIVNGSKAYVEAAAIADVILVTARSESGLSQVLVPAASDGVRIVKGRSIDFTRRFGRVEFVDVRLPQEAVLGEIGSAGPAAERQTAVALALQCAETVGIADRIFELTLAYAKDRWAFGRPIASFQALKHRFADMLMWLEFSKAIAEGAVEAIDNEDDGYSHLASIAKAYVAEHCLDLIDDCVQISGGIGVTWEYDLHLYSRRATLNRAIYGSPEEHKEKICGLVVARSDRRGY